MTSQSNTRNDARVDTHEELGGTQRESKLELFGFDSLVNILGLKRYLMRLNKNNCLHSHLVMVSNFHCLMEQEKHTIFIDMNK